MGGGCDYKLGLGDLETFLLWSLGVTWKSCQAIDKEKISCIHIVKE